MLKKLQPTKIYHRKCSKLVQLVTAETLQQLFNQALTTGEFPTNLKNADVTLVFKKNNPLSKENYRPVGGLPIILKLFEKLMQNQINPHIKSFLSPYLWGYRKGFNSQHALNSSIKRFFLYNYGSTQTYTKLKIYNHQALKYSKGIWK